MRATMMLADYAQIADGKLFISGGGWSTCGPGPTPCAVVTIFHVPWQETDEKVSFALRLIDEDGRAVMQPGATDGLPVQGNGHFEARRQPGSARPRARSPAAGPAATCRSGWPCPRWRRRWPRTGRSARR